MKSRENTPRTLGRYELVLPIGTGGMGVVYLGRTSGAHGFVREVAIKVLRSDRDGGSADDLVREARIAGLVRHPNVVQVVDVGDQDGEVYLVMELVEGDSLFGLEKALKRASGTLLPEVGLRILLDGLAGLHAAHELRDETTGEPLGLVHRDFSPQNLLVGTNGVTRLTDFGIAKMAESDRHTTAGVVKGKFSYMSPEQARSERLDRRSDVWAAAVVAWEIVTHRRLYPAGNDANTLLSIVSSDAPDPREVDPDLPPALAEAIMCGLSRDRTRRCPTAHAFAQRLRDGAAACGIEIASDEAVRAVLLEQVGERLAAQRAQIREALASRQAPDAAPPVDAPAAEPTPASIRVDPPGEGVVAQTIRLPVEHLGSSVIEMTEARADRGRGRFLSILGVVAVVALGSLGYAAFRSSREAAPASTAPEPHASAATAEPTAAAQPEARADEPTVTASALVEPTPASSASARQTVTGNVGRPQPRPRPSTEKKPKCPEWGRCR